jgi:hypothetical protein
MMLDKPEFVEARWVEPPGTVPVAWDRARGSFDAAAVLVLYGAYDSRARWSSSTADGNA